MPGVHVGVYRVRVDVGAGGACWFVLHASRIAVIHNAFGGARWCVFMRVVGRMVWVRVVCHVVRVGHVYRVLRPGARGGT